MIMCRTTWWRLVLDEGERLEVRLTDSAPAKPGEPDVALFMPAWRAADLGRVMETYSRIVAIVAEASQVSGTRAWLAR
jgi:hypothetical protein